MEYEFKSVAVEFQELCSRHNEHSYMDSITQLFGVNNRVRFSTTSQMIGIMLGSAIAGQLSDLYGRKKVRQKGLLSIKIKKFEFPAKNLFSE